MEAKPMRTAKIDSQRVEVIIPGVDKLGIACEKPSSTSGCAYNNL